MADYQDIRGLRVKYLSADPSVTVGGEVWYNSTTATLRSHLISEAWASAAPLAQERGQISMFGTQTSSVAAGGSGPGATMYNNTEEYNGSGWSAGGDLNTTREGSHAAGVLTAGVIVGGFIEPSTYSNAAEEYDGTTWTSVTVAPYAVNNTAAFGTQAASMFAGGDPGSKTTTLEYASPGSWTAGGALTTGRAQAGGACLAPLSAGLIWGGTPLSTAVEEYNGTAWSDGTVLPAGVQFGGGAGTQTAALSFANFSGPTTITTATTKYDGTSWTAAPALGISQARSQGSGSQALALVAGGDYPHTTPVNTTQEFTQSGNVITAGAWSSKPAMSLARYGGASGGSPTAAFYATGYSGSYTATTEEFDGSSWGAGGSITDTSTQSTGGAGTLTAGLKMGGSTATPYDFTEEYNGTAWTGVPGTLNTTTPGQGTSGSGIQTAAIYTRGRPTTDNETYNGTTWTTKTTISGTARSGNNSGTSTAALYIGGEQPPGPYLGEVEEFNGTSWTTKGSLVIPQGGASNSGPSTDTIVASGYTLTAPWGPGNVTETQKFDGTAWYTAPHVATARSSGGSSNRGTGGGSNGALVFAGNTTAVEEFTAETSAANIVTLTTS